MSTLRVNNIQFNPDGNTIISAVNTNNIVITVDGTEKLKVAKEGVNFRGPISVNNTPIFGGSGEFTATINLVNQVSGTLNVSNGGTGLTSVGTSGNVLTSNGTSWISQAASGFDSGTVMLFGQTTAPTGWTKNTTHNNKALRVVTGTVGSGGSVAFTTAFSSKAVSGSISSEAVSGTIGSTTVTGTVGATTLSTAQMPSHTHTFNFVASGIAATAGGNQFGASSSASTGAAGGGGSHDHTFSGGSHNHTFTGGSHNHTFTGTAIDMSVQYVDIIMATKD